MLAGTSQAGHESLPGTSSNMGDVFSDALCVGGWKCTDATFIAADRETMNPLRGHSD